MVFINASRPNGDFIAASVDTIAEAMVEAASLVAHDDWDEVRVRSGFEVDDLDVRVTRA